MLPPSDLPASDRQRRGVGIALIALSATAFGAMPILARWAYDDGAEPAALLFLRFAIASLVMVPMILARRPVRPAGGVLWGLVAMGAIGYVGQSMAYFTALTLIPAGLVALLLYLYPAIVTILAARVFRQSITPLRAGAVAIAVGGTALTLAGPGSSRGETSLLGIALAIGAALIYSVYILTGSRLIPGIGPLAASTIVTTSAAVVLGAIAILEQPAFPQSAAGWSAAAAIALVSTVLAIVAFFAGLERVGPADAATLSTLEPIVTLLLGALLLSEVLTVTQLVGGVCILAAVLVLARSETPAGSAHLVPDPEP